MTVMSMTKTVMSSHKASVCLEVMQPNIPVKNGVRLRREPCRASVHCVNLPQTDEGKVRDCLVQCLYAMSVSVSL